MTKTTLTWRVGQLEKTLCRMEKRMDVLMENHLPHLEQRMIRIETKMNVLSAINIGAIILAVIINKFL